MDGILIICLPVLIIDHLYPDLSLVAATGIDLKGRLSVYNRTSFKRDDLFSIVGTERLKYAGIVAQKLNNFSLVIRFRYYKMYIAVPSPVTFSSSAVPFTLPRC